MCLFVYMPVCLCACQIDPQEAVATALSASSSSSSASLKDSKGGTKGGGKGGKGGGSSEEPSDLHVQWLMSPSFVLTSAPHAAVPAGVEGSGSESLGQQHARQQGGGRGECAGEVVGCLRLRGRLLGCAVAGVRDGFERVLADIKVRAEALKKERGS